METLGPVYDEILPPQARARLVPGSQLGLELCMSCVQTGASETEQLLCSQGGGPGPF